MMNSSAIHEQYRSALVSVILASLGGEDRGGGHQAKHVQIEDCYLLRGPREHCKDQSRDLEDFKRHSASVGVMWLFLGEGAGVNK